MTHGDFEVRMLDEDPPSIIGQIWRNDAESVFMYTDHEGNDYDIVKTASDNKELRKLLELANCPDENCDGKGTCAALGPGYDGESDVDFWECRWCLERALVLHRNDT